MRNIKRHKLLLIFITIYMLSVSFNLWFNIITYSSIGTRSNSNPGIHAIISIYTPVLNNVMSIYFIIDYPPYIPKTK